jgi:hypothetical protein
MFEAELPSAVAQKFREGTPPSQLLRDVALHYPEASVPDLMELLQKALSLSYTDVQCIGGWWHDGTGELDDRQLDSFLTDAIARAGHEVPKQVSQETGSPKKV